MFTLSYAEFINRDSEFNSYSIYYMPGLKVASIESSTVYLNTSTKCAYIYNS